VSVDGVRSTRQCRHGDQAGFCTPGAGLERVESLHRRDYPAEFTSWSAMGCAGACATKQGNEYNPVGFGSLPRPGRADVICTAMTSGRADARCGMCHHPWRWGWRMTRVLVAMVFLLGAGPALGGERVALVIGEASYQTVSPLANPVADAKLVAQALARAGFEVRLGTDLDKPRSMRRSTISPTTPSRRRSPRSTSRDTASRTVAATGSCRSMPRFGTRAT